jgi:hypothetical protein
MTQQPSLLAQSSKLSSSQQKKKGKRRRIEEQGKKKLKTMRFDGAENEDSSLLLRSS